MKLRAFSSGVVFLAGAAVVVNCGSGSDDGLYTGTGANGGRAGSSGSGATLGAGGTGPAGASGASGNGGTTDASAGTAGSNGGANGSGASLGQGGTTSSSGGTTDASAGTAGGGSGGALGSAGTNGAAGVSGTLGRGGGGSAGSSGSTGTAGSSGSTGTGGSNGSAGSSGSAGSAGSAGSSGSAGTPGDAGPDADASTPCTTNADCATDELCAKATCGAPSGQCEPRPKTCIANYAPVCGCDKVNYWNDCLRQQVGVLSSTSGECASSAPCGGLVGMECPVARALCARLLESDSACGGADTFGACWVVPEQCPGIVLGGNYRPCSGPGNQCENKCQAIKSEHDRFTDPSCAL